MDSKVSTGTEAEDDAGREAALYRDLARTPTENFVARAQDITRTVNNFSKNGADRAVEAARNAYAVELADDGEVLAETMQERDLRNFSGLLLEARDHYVQESRLIDQGATMDAKERKQILLNRQSYVREMAEFVSDGHEEIPPAYLRRWLETVSGDPENKEWAQKLVDDIAAQVAVRDALLRVPGVRSVEYDVAGELGSGDLFAELRNGKTMSVAVDTAQRRMPEEGVEERRGVVVVGVPTAAVEDYALKPEAAEHLVQQLNLV